MVVGRIFLMLAVSGEWKMLRRSQSLGKVQAMVGRLIQMEF